MTLTVSEVAPSLSPLAASAASTAQDRLHLEWFRCRTSTKLPGTFVSGFWSTLLMQASLSEPVVLHAVLALSSVHRVGILDGDRQPLGPCRVPDKREQYTLEHYGKAISSLRRNLSTTDRASLRIALIACVTLVCMDFLRGHFSTAQVHVRAGLELLSAARPGPGGGAELADDWIAEMFSRLYVQMELFQQPFQHRSLSLPVAEPRSIPLIFHTLKDAWVSLEMLLRRVFGLTGQARNAPRRPLPSALREAQKIVQEELRGWLNTYEASSGMLRRQGGPEGDREYWLLRVYHTMAHIIAGTCLDPGYEGIFDQYTHRFVEIIKQSVALWVLSSPTTHPAETWSPATAAPRRLDMAASIEDHGWIQPLYYVASKCRVHRVRLHAVRLLERSFHREGIWDSDIAARVARKIMEMEGRGFYEGSTAEDFTIDSLPTAEDLSLPSLPESQRIRDVGMVLSGQPLDRVLLLCTKTQEDGTDRRIRIAEYHVASQRWTEVHAPAES